MLKIKSVWTTKHDVIVLTSEGKHLRYLSNRYLPQSARERLMLAVWEKREISSQYWALV